MNGADDTHTDPDPADSSSAQPYAAGMTDEEFAAALAALEARVTAAASPGYVVAHTNMADVVRELQERQQEIARRAADPRTADQMRAEVGELLQRFYDARWYGSPEDVQRTREELGHALRETQYLISVPAEVIDPGTYVRAVGRDPNTGRPTSVSGIVDEANHMSRRDPGRVTGEEYGVHFVVTPPQRDGHRRTAYQVFVDEAVRLIQLPAPVDRGRPVWMEHRLTHTASLPHGADAGGPSPSAPAGSAAESAVADPTHLPNIGSARPFPPPDRIHATAPAPAAPPVPPTGPVRDRHR